MYLHYARFVKMEEIIEKNDYNLNIPRYITARDTEIQQDIDAHLHGGLPKHDIDQMEVYWKLVLHFVMHYSCRCLVGKGISL